MGYGGYHPYPRRFGGNRYSRNRPLVQVVHESIGAQRGEAFDTTNENTIVWVETNAWARALTFDGWEVNARLAYQWDPRRMTDMLPRWEAIYKIRPSATATDRSRRAVVLERRQRFGKTSNHARLETRLRTELGNYFVQLEYISIAVAVVHVPDGTYPWGTVVAGVTWYSTVAHFLVKLQKPTGATEEQFYAAAGKVAAVLDPIVSAFCTFDWYRAPTGGAPINVPGGPSAGGFYLDQDANLDNQVFDV